MPCSNRHRPRGPVRDGVAGVWVGGTYYAVDLETEHVVVTTLATTLATLPPQTFQIDWYER